METPGIRKYRLESPAGGLTQSVVSEALHGFRLEHFDQTIGTSRKEFHKLLVHFGDLPEDGVSLNLPQVFATRFAKLCESLERKSFRRELGRPLNMGKGELDGVIRSESITGQF